MLSGESGASPPELAPEDNGAAAEPQSSLRASSETLTRAYPQCGWHRCQIMF